MGQLPPAAHSGGRQNCAINSEKYIVWGRHGLTPPPTRKCLDPALFEVLSRSFTVDYENNCFLKDGEPFRYVSGSIHYFRVPPEYWYDRIQKMKMAGLNAIQTYVEWSGHEPESGMYNFDGYYDLPKFLQTALDLDMLVILRAGPFIDAERDMGGLPYWLLRLDPNMKFRTYDETFIYYINRWYSTLLPLIEPYLYNNGGPIITVQIENEYGSTSICDAQYKSHLRDFFNRLLKKKVVLFTTDGSSSTALMCGKTDQVLSTVDFGAGANVTQIFEYVRWHQASGPLVNSEFYPGWLDHWGAPHAQVDSKEIVKTLTEILQANGSVNVYMFHGGTSFGFGAGSNLGSSFQACPTSYDYDAPLSEAGDPTPKYFDMREAIGKFLPLPPGPLPKPSPKMKTPKITLKKVASLWEFVSLTSNTVKAPFPLSFEDLSHPYGFVLYSTSINVVPTDPAVLTVKDVGDRAYVYVNKILQGILSREQKVYSIPIKVLKGETIDILVENQGRVCFGSGINDRKGIFQNVTLGSHKLLNWTMKPILLDAKSLKKAQLSSKVHTKAISTDVPTIYAGTFTAPNMSIYDSFLNVNGWHKGVAFLNSFNLGRYWPVVGPQVTLYTPKIYFKTDSNVNTVLLFELEHAPCANEEYCTVEFVKKPVINGTTPTSTEKKQNVYGKKILSRACA